MPNDKHETWAVCSSYSNEFTCRVPIKVGSAPAITIIETLGMPKGDEAVRRAHAIVRDHNHAPKLAEALREVLTWGPFSAEKARAALAAYEKDGGK